jgi:hypothetical protein
MHGRLFKSEGGGILTSARALLEPNEAGASLEVTASDGARMVLRMPAGSAFDLAGLLTSFLGRRLAQQGSSK